MSTYREATVAETDELDDPTSQLVPVTPAARCVVFFLSGPEGVSAAAALKMSVHTVSSTDAESGKRRAIVNSAKKTPLSVCYEMSV